MSKRPFKAVLRDYVTLSKPGIVRMCAITTAGGLWLSPEPVTTLEVAAALGGSALTVASANAFNMVWERESDRKMPRTRKRPVADGRITPKAGVIFASVVGLLGLAILVLGTNWLTAGLALAALASYVLVYTPLKYKTPAALLIGTLPGAVPPLLGYTAASGTFEMLGVILFGILLVWQMPHFLAIALYRKEEYAKAGICCVPVARGDKVAKRQAVFWSAALLPVSLMLAKFGFTGGLYFTLALLLGSVYFVWSLTGLRQSAGASWARGYFLASLVYLPGLTLALILDVVF